MEASPRTPTLEEVGVRLSHLWWLWLTSGVLWTVIALVILQFDQASVTTVGVLIGIMFLLSGFEQLFFGSLARGLLQFVLWSSASCSSWPG